MDRIRESSNAHFQAIVERDRGLHKSLSTGQLSMIAIGGAIPDGAALYMEDQELDRTIDEIRSILDEA